MTAVLLSAEETDKHPSFALIFHDMGRNALGALTAYYGLNLIGAGLGSWGFIESGADIWWRNFAYRNTAIAHAGLPALYVGYAVPALTPLMLYLAGRLTDNTRLHIAALALTQTLILTLAIQTPLKMITGRAGPGIITDLTHTRGLATDDHSRIFNRFNMDFINGWPSGHTANAFSAAAALAEIYPDNRLLVAGAYAYAALIGLGVSVNVHWASDVFAGALIGWAIGKTTGKSFARLLRRTDTACAIAEKRKTVMPYITPHIVGVRIAW